MPSEMITVEDHLSIVADKDDEIRTLRSELEQSRARCEALREGIRARRALEGDGSGSPKETYERISGPLSGDLREEDEDAIRVAETIVRSFPDDEDGRIEFAWQCIASYRERCVSERLSVMDENRLFWKGRSEQLEAQLAEARRPVSSDELKGTAFAIASELDTAISESSTARVVEMLASIAGRPIAPEPVDEAEIERAAEPLFRHFLLGDNDDAANAEMIRNALRAIARRPMAIDEAALREAIHGAVNEHMDELIDEPEETTNDDAVKRILSAIRPLLTAPAAAMNEASAEGGES